MAETPGAWLKEKRAAPFARASNVMMEPYRMEIGIKYHRWAYRVDHAEQHLVFPDGCRDVLIVRHPDGSTHVDLTQFDVRPRIAHLTPGTALSGYRLRPGTVVPPHALEAVAVQPDHVEAILDDACGGWSDLDEAIAQLCLPAARLGAVCRGMGVSTRTMQRRFRVQHLPPPDDWRLLARARRAAGLLSSDAPLAEIAAACDFSDQAHMTRDLLRWFGFSPAQLRRRATLLERLRQPALGNWTGEQISTR